jgi:predicted metal-dependent peptidase
MNPNNKAERAMMKARLSMLKAQPFWGMLALRLPLVEREDLDPPTLATDGESLFYHPHWVLTNSDNVRQSGVAHEVGHCMFQHMARLGVRQPKRWNHACDYVINWLLRDSGFTVPDSWLIDGKYAGMYADQVYELLPEDGAGAGGKGSFDAMLPPPPGGGTEAAQTAKAREWAVAIVQAANSAAKAGKLPGSLTRFVEHLLDNKADWRTLLRRFITERSREGFDWMKPNKRFAAMGIYLPGRYSQCMQTLVVVTDDSGSISQRVLNAFSAETAAARDAATPETTWVISCDARVNHVDELGPDDPFKVKCHGGGGTDFRPPFAWLEEQGITPSCLVYLTDLEGPFPAAPPDYPVLWCTINNKIAPWGETVKVEV